jgi:hypothetical protein
MKKIICFLFLIFCFNLYAAEREKMGTYIVEYRDYDRSWRWNNGIPEGFPRGWEYKEFQRTVIVDMHEYHLGILFTDFSPEIMGSNRYFFYKNGATQIWPYAVPDWTRNEILYDKVFEEREPDALSREFKSLLEERLSSFEGEWSLFKDTDFNEEEYRWAGFYGKETDENGDQYYRFRLEYIIYYTPTEY